MLVYIYCYNTETKEGHIMYHGCTFKLNVAAEMIQAFTEYDIQIFGKRKFIYELRPYEKDAK